MEMGEEGCADCTNCEDFTECFQSVRRAVGYLSACMARLIEKYQITDEKIMKYLTSFKKNGKKDQRYDDYFS